MPETNEKTGGFSDAATHFEDGLARICRLYGVSPLAGRLYALLFLSPTALSLDELCRRTGAAKSSVSVALRKLIGIRVVRRLPPRGDRRDYLEVIADPWTLLSEWNRLFFEPELEMWRSSGDRLDRALASAADAPSGEENAVIRARVRALSDFAEVAAQFLSQATRSQQEKPKARAIPIALEDAS